MEVWNFLEIQEYSVSSIRNDVPFHVPFHMPSPEKRVESMLNFGNMKIGVGRMKKLKTSPFFVARFMLFLLVLLWVEAGWAIPDGEIQKIQAGLQGKTTGEKIAFFAERFIGTPYDEDPRGLYVSKTAIVADERVDCMYLTFRAVELALSDSPEEAVQIALEKRFHSQGILKDGRVVNYDDRFQYGEDMIQSGKWGREITSEIGRTIWIQGSRGKNFWTILPPKELLKEMGKIKSGDILFFATAPEKRKADECIGHIGIAKIEKSEWVKKIYMIHPSGVKNRGGAVKKVLLPDYVSRMAFVGVRITRFE